MSGTVKTVGQTTIKEWRFAEAQWYCADCGIVSSADVQKDEQDARGGRMPMRSGNQQNNFLIINRNVQV